MEREGEGGDGLKRVRERGGEIYRKRERDSYCKRGIEIWREREREKERERRRRE